MPTCRTSDPAQHPSTGRLPAAAAPGGRAMRGFNLIELMIVIAIAAIGLSLALPSFTDAMARNRIASTSNEFIAAVMYARSEALQRNTTTGFCASADKIVCGGNWSDGWIVWADIDRNGVLNPGEVLRQGLVSEKDSLTSVSTNAIEFGPRGFPNVGVTPGNDALFVLEPEDCDAGKRLRRELTVSATGQIRTGRTDEELVCT